MYPEEEKGGLDAVPVERTGVPSTLGTDDFEVHHGTVPIKWNVSVIVRQCSVVWALE